MGGLLIVLGGRLLISRYAIREAAIIEQVAIIQSETQMEMP